MRKNHAPPPTLTHIPSFPSLSLRQKLVEKLKRERFRAIFDYLSRGEGGAAPAAAAAGAALGAPLNLLEVVQVGLCLLGLA